VDAAATSRRSTPRVQSGEGRQTEKLRIFLTPIGDLAVVLWRDNRI
jgi:hypothetical protein